MAIMSESPEIRTTLGIVRGEESAGIRRFLGIPYAAPPFGANRFRAPQPVPAWTDVREATGFGPTPPQLPYAGATADLLGGVRIDGEDILTANVWTPADAADAPVVLWIHSGALERGTAAIPLYDGGPFARAGIVFVSINYRLGSEGFSVLDDAPRNLGLLDADAALRWVHREIEAFGGDPRRITLMGESAGGALVAALLSRESSRQLVAAAIVQSGPLDAQAPKKGGRVTAQLARQLGVALDRAAFAALPPERLLDARRVQAAGSSPLGGAPGFQFVIDPETLPVSPREALADVDVPLLIGTNTDEYRLWFTPESLAGIRPSKLFLARLALRIPGKAVKAYRRDWPDATTGELFGQLATDLLLRAPATRAARSRTAPTYLYEFAWRSPVRDLRAGHALELGFVFDALQGEDSVRMAGNDAPQGLADEMNAAWIRFIHTGDPGWPRFDHARATRLFDTETTTVPQRRTAGLDLLP